MFNIFCIVRERHLFNGVVNALPHCENIDSTDFSGTFQDTAMADNVYASHMTIKNILEKHRLIQAFSPNICYNAIIN